MPDNQAQAAGGREAVTRLRIDDEELEVAAGAAVLAAGGNFVWMTERPCDPRHVRSRARRRGRAAALVDGSRADATRLRRWRCVELPVVDAARCFGEVRWLVTESQVQAVVDLAVSRFGKLDCMFNNAGAAGVSGEIDQTPVEAFDLTVSVLLRGVFLGIKHAARVMKPARSGSIISTASVAGLQTGWGPHTYSACKAAVIQLTASVAVELGAHGLRRLLPWEKGPGLPWGKTSLDSAISAEVFAPPGLARRNWPCPPEMADRRAIAS